MESAGDSDMHCELARELRCAWLNEDAKSAGQIMSMLAPRYDYSPQPLAAALNVSVRQLQRIFTALLGCPPRAWLQRQRLLEAKRRLPSASSVKEVALTLGFRSASHFSRAFNDHFGIKPSACIVPVQTGALTSRASSSSSALAAFKSPVSNPSVNQE